MTRSKSKWNPCKDCIEPLAKAFEQRDLSRTTRLKFDEIRLDLVYRHLHVDACQRWIEINFSPERAAEFGTKLADAMRRLSSWEDVFVRWDCQDWYRLVEMESCRLKHPDKELVLVKEHLFDEDEETEEQFVKRTWPLRLPLINCALQRTNGDIMEHFMLAYFRSPPGQPAGSIGATDEVMWDLMHIRDDCDMLAEVADWLKQLAGEIELATPPEAAHDEPDKPISPDMATVLLALRDSQTIMTQERIEKAIRTSGAKDSRVSKRTIQKIMPKLEAWKWVIRPDGKRSGYMLAPEGERIVATLGPGA